MKKKRTVNRPYYKQLYLEQQKNHARTLDQWHKDVKEHEEKYEGLMKQLDAALKMNSVLMEAVGRKETQHKALQAYVQELWAQTKKD